MNKTRNPIFVVDETGTVEYFTSIDQAVLSIESPDVGLVRVYDADGRIINLDVEGESRSKFHWFFETIIPGVIHPVSTNEFDEPGLHKALLETLSVLSKHPKFASRLEGSTKLEQLSLPSLIETLIHLVPPAQ